MNPSKGQGDDEAIPALQAQLARGIVATGHNARPSQLSQFDDADICVTRRSAWSVWCEHEVVSSTETCRQRAYGRTPSSTARPAHRIMPKTRGKRLAIVTITTPADKD